MAIDIVVVVLVVVLLPSLGGAPALLLCQGDRGYKESSQVGYNCCPNRTLSLVFPNYNI
jgi:hypothetical protein